MIEFLAMQIRLGKITLDQVPERFRADVATMLYDSDPAEVEAEDYHEEEEQ